jgi:FkbM family methyltransferase
MGFGKILLDRFGLQVRYQPFFENLVRIGAMGMGYGLPMLPKESHVIELAALKRGLGAVKERDPVVFDVGANKGDYVALILEAAGDRRVIIHAFEPDTTVAARLRERFKDHAGLKVVMQGLSDTPGELEFTRYSQNTLSSFHMDDAMPGSVRKDLDREVVRIPLNTIDVYCQAQGIGHIDFLKIDTEGHDLFVLQGAARMIAERRIGRIQFEFSAMNLFSRSPFVEFWNLLTDGYTLHRPLKDGDYAMRAYEPLIDELYHPINFLAIRRP